MEMEVIVPVHNMDFDFNSARSSPRMSPPSTPKPFGGEFYFSAPNSPSHLTQFYRDFDDFLVIGNGTASASAVPFDWEIKPGTPKSPRGFDQDFAFDVSEEMETASVSAEELFDGGVIKPLKPPPRLQPPRPGEDRPMSPRSPISHGKRIIKGAFSPRHKKQVDPASTAAYKSGQRTPERERGRDRAHSLSSSSRRATRSLSPLRVSQYPWEEEQQQQQQQQKTGHSSGIPKPAASSSSGTCSALSTSTSSKSFRKWRLKDFFLFRSASEGRAADKDPLKKYSAAFRDAKQSSFRSIDSPGSSGSLSSRRRGPVSAHELHYTVNRAVSEDLKKKTFLPYKQGILGRLAFNPAVHALANGFGLSRK